MTGRTRSGRAPRTEATLDPAQPLARGALARSPSRFLAVYELGRQLLEQKRPADVLQALQAAILQHLAPDQGCLLSFAADGAPRALWAHEVATGGEPDAWPVSWTVIGQVQSEGQALLASEVQRDTLLKDAQSLQRFRIRSVVCVPLGRPPRGVLYLANRSERPFGEADLEFLTALALYASLVLDRLEEHAQTSDALRASDERLEVLREELLRCQLVGRAPALLSAFDAVRRFAQAGARVVLRGETGTGKELFARAYARHSGRAQAAYVPVTIPALAPTLVESELFGHLKGAFTEAARDKKGRLEIAHGGVLFLDEVGDIEPAVQVKLLRFLDSGELFRVGATEARRVDTLVVSATNRPLDKDVESGRFRADLLARLGHVIEIPPLRERPDDIPLLVAHFLERHGRGARAREFAPETLELLRGHTWPFNVRELQQVVERAVVLVDRHQILPDDLPEYLRRTARERLPAAAPCEPLGPPRPMREVVAEAERAHLLRALAYTGGNRRKAMELLQLSPDTFYRRLEEHGLHKKG